MLTVIITSPYRNYPALYRMDSIETALNIGCPTYGEVTNIYIDGRVHPIATLTYGA